MHDILVLILKFVCNWFMFCSSVCNLELWVRLRQTLFQQFR